MNATLTRQLVARHPVLLSMPHGTVIAERGIECGDGWYDVIDEMLIGIADHCVTVGSCPPAARQIKEKFGLLRVYTTPSGDDIRAILNAFEQRSATCCERCGRAGQLVTTPFPQVRCEHCRAASAA